MNYENIYNQIIEKAKSENRSKGNGIYYESKPEDIKETDYLAIESARSKTI